MKLLHTGHMGMQDRVPELMRTNNLLDHPGQITVDRDASLAVLGHAKALAGALRLAHLLK